MLDRVVEVDAQVELRDAVANGYNGVDVSFQICSPRLTVSLEAIEDAPASLDGFPVAFYSDLSDRTGGEKTYGDRIT
jgi:hypothetical protein